MSGAEPDVGNGDASPGAVKDGLRAPGEPILTQAEIDGITSYAEEAKDATGDLRSVADGSAVSREPMPMLDVVISRFVKGAASGLKDLLKADADLTLAQLTAQRFGEYMDGFVQPTQSFLYKISGQGGQGLITIGVDTAYLVFEKLLGGVPTAGRSRPGARPPTPIETRILGQLATFLLREAERSFAQLAPLSFELSGAESEPRAMQVLLPGEAVLVAVLRLEIDGQFGEIDFMLPFGAVESIRPLLKGRFNGEKLGRDSVWAAHLSTEIWKADIGAEAVLHEMRIPLGRVLDLSVGETLMLDVKPTDLVTLRCADQVLTRGRIGRLDGRIAIQVTEPLRPGRSVAFNEERLFS